MNDEIENALQNFIYGTDTCAQIRGMYEDKRARIMSKIADELAELDAEYAPTLDRESKELNTQEKRLRALVLAHGESVKTSRVNILFSDGKITWDTKGLHGYAVSKPEILAFRSIGKPFTTVQWMAKDE